MKIVLSGVETNNKGAELMLYAILQEIERRHPEAIVYIPRDRMFHELSYVKTKLDFRYIPCGKFEQKFHLASVFEKLEIPFQLLPHMIGMGKVDYFVDASGFRFSDKFKHSAHSSAILQCILSAYKKQGTKIIYLPQAFGPFEKKASRDVLSVLNNYATVLMPREKVSLQYLEDSGITNMAKVKMFTDFTSLVEGVFPTQYEHLRNGICVIPNKQMINKGAIGLDGYISLLESIINNARKSGKVVYLLNHEGGKDEQLCKDLQKRLPDIIQYVSGLNALEVKGLIASAYLTVSSRFHGVASSLNSCVPCLATSWSHKYQELFNDYSMSDCVLPIEDIQGAINMIDNYLDENINSKVRNILRNKVPHIKEENRKMWEFIWTC